MRLDAPRDRTTRPRSVARAMAYVARDGAVAARPFSLVAALWGALDVVDAFFRTLLVEGHADAYARRTTTARAPTPERVAATTARAGSRTCERSITPRRRRADEDDKGRHGGVVARRLLRPTTTTPRVPSAPTRAKNDAPSDRARARDAAVGMTSTTSPPRSMTAPSLGARGAHAVNENPTAARNNHS